MAQLRKERKSRVKLFSFLPSYARTSFAISFVVSITILVLALVAFFTVQPEIPIFYSLPRSDQQLGQKAWIFLFPVLSWSISLLHLTIIKLLPDLKMIIARLFSWSTAVIQLTLFIIFLRILIVI